MKGFRFRHRTRYQRLSDAVAAVKELAADIPLPETVEDEQALRSSIWELQPGA